MQIREIFVELHDGEPKNPRPIQISVSDIRMISAVKNEDYAYLETFTNGDSYKTRIVFKGDAWIIFVHEPPHEVYGLCGFDISR